jgi:hypothetical protein
MFHISASIEAKAWRHTAHEYTLVLLMKDGIDRSLSNSDVRTQPPVWRLYSPHFQAELASGVYSLQMACKNQKPQPG